MKQISALDIYYLQRELKELSGARVDTIYMVLDVLYIKVYVSGLGSRFLVYRLGKFLFLDDKKKEGSRNHLIVTYMRKYLSNAFIKDISQVLDERIIRIDLERRSELETREYRVYLELFSTGNIVVCDSEDLILQIFQRKKYKDRELFSGVKYELPPSRELSFINLDISLGLRLMAESELSLVKFLALKFGLGGKFSEEICIRAQILKDEIVSRLKEEDVRKIFLLVAEMLNQDLKPCIIVNNENLALDFMPFKFESISLKEDEKVLELGKFSLALREYYSQFMEEKDVNEEFLLKELKKLEVRLEKLDEQKKEGILEYERLNSSGLAIYENYSKLEDLLSGLLRASREKGWDYVIWKINSDERLKKIIIKIEPLNNELVVDTSQL